MQEKLTYCRLTIKLKLITLFLFVISFHFINGQNITNSTNIHITKFWPQQPNGFTYPIHIHVPQGNPPSGGYPVAILLHGNGGNGNQTIFNVKNTLECHVLVAPTGYQNSWNICSENSNAPDTEMIYDLVNQLQSYSNINSNKIRILGFSNGAALANNVFIQNDNQGIDIICSVISQLNEPQYHLNSFWKSANNTDPSLNYCGYNVQSYPTNNRKYLSICNDNDMTIPYYGGQSAVGLNFIHAEEAAYSIAKNNGYLGPKIDSAAGFPLGLPVVFEYAYSSVGVFHIRGNAGHGINITQNNYIKNFLNDCNSVSNYDSKELNQLLIYPNPTSSFITIKHESNLPLSFRLYDVFGRTIKQFNSKHYETTLDLTKFNDSFYFLKIDERIVKIAKYQGI